MPKIAISIATRNRNEMLAMTLRSLARVKQPDGITLFVLIADNDCLRGAEQTVNNLQDEIDFVLRYFCVEKQGIPSARNALLREGIALGCEFLIFIDDDEILNPEWLITLWRQFCHRALGVVAVHGPVLPLFEVPPPSWLPTKLYSKPLNLPSGTLTKVAATNNVLLDLDEVSKKKLFFDERMALIGGSDTEFFKRWYSLGGRFEWCNEGFVYEVIPVNRMRFSWLCRRQFRYGTSGAFINRKYYTFPRALVRNLICFIKIFSKSIFNLISFGHEKAFYVEEILNSFKSIGFLFGSFGLNFKEYRKR